jgi:ribonuclease R
MEEKILGLLGHKDYWPLNVPELLWELKLSPDQQQVLQKKLRVMVRGGQIARIKGNRYILPTEADLIPGRISINRSGRGFLQPDDPKISEVGIPPNATSTSMHGDRVLVRRDIPKKRRDTSEDAVLTGKVVEVLERRRTQIVGVLKRSRQLLYVIPDDAHFPYDVYVPEPKDVGRQVRVDDKVVVELTNWESQHTNPEGEIIEVLGAADAEGVDMLSILKQHELPLRFPKKVLQEIKGLGKTVGERDLVDREDCRTHPIITIDPDDAKDFDDAICVKRESGDRWRLWVHIADVSHYVVPGSSLDDEAQARGNSTYLVDRVIPMLPEGLSNELCSLKPEIDRLTKCVEFLIDADGSVVRSKFYPAVIHSKQRLTYKEAFSILESKPKNALEKMLHDANKLAQQLRRLRFVNGALNLDFQETKILLDDHGRVDRIERVENDLSHQLIEEFMLLANEAVAKRLKKQRIKTIYRVHEEPDPRRLKEYREDILSHNIRCGDLTKPIEVQKLLKRLTGLPMGPALKIGLLKSLKRAQYSVEPLGHYGLAKVDYAHFTSPIRRYADLVVHRTLFQKGKAADNPLKQIAEHISDTERNSAEAERASKQVKLFAYLNAQLETRKPHPYSGLVIEIRNFGFFVDVADLGMSGLVPLSALKNDFFVFDPARNRVVGRRTKRRISVGDQVQVKVLKVDTSKKQVDFILIDGAKGARKEKSDSRSQERKPRKDYRSRNQGRSKGDGQTKTDGKAKAKSSSPKKRSSLSSSSGD